MRLLTKAEACRELGVSLSTLDRRVASGEIRVRREEQGRRRRVYVMLDDDPPENGEDDQPQDAAQERIRGLEEQVELLKTQLHLERERNAGIGGNLSAGARRAREDETSGLHPWPGRRRTGRDAGRRRHGYDIMRSEQAALSRP